MTVPTQCLFQLSHRFTRWAAPGIFVWAVCGSGLNAQPVPSDTTLGRQITTQAQPAEQRIGSPSPKQSRGLVRLEEISDPPKPPHQFIRLESIAEPVGSEQAGIPAAQGPIVQGLVVQGGVAPSTLPVGVNPQPLRSGLVMHGQRLPTQQTSVAAPHATFGPTYGAPTPGSYDGIPHAPGMPTPTTAPSPWIQNQFTPNQFTQNQFTQPQAIQKQGIPNHAIQNQATQSRLSGDTGKYQSPLPSSMPHAPQGRSSQGVQHGSVVLSPGLPNPTVQTSQSPEPQTTSYPPAIQHQPLDLSPQLGESSGPTMWHDSSHSTQPQFVETTLVGKDEGLFRGAWWQTHVKQSQRDTPKALNVSLNSLLVGALRNSAKIQVISDEPLIAEQDITAADSEFDWVSFLEARWDDTSDPVGSTLTTGGASRFRDHNATMEGGVRRRNTLGGEFEVSQRYGHQNNNSVFFVPNNQGTSRLTLSYTQPLLRGAGRVYNTSVTVLAKLNTEITQDDFSRQLQDHLIDITQSYWNLYFERGRLLQQQRLLDSGVQIMDELESRREIDALQSQIVRARAAVENRRAELVRSRLAIKNAEARVRSLVNDPRLGDTTSLELIPKEDLSEAPFAVDLRSAISESLQFRPEVSAALKQVKSACIRMNIGKNETLPLLNVVMDTYTAGLKGNGDIREAWMAMFDEGEPGYGIGLQFERPIWNRAATSRLQKRRLEVRRLQHQFRLTVETLKLEVEVAVHELNAAFESLNARRRAMDAAAEEVEYLLDRWQLLPTDNGSASLLLEDLLDAQERLAGAELGMLQASLEYTLAQGGYKRATGTLLKHNRISVDRNCECKLPQQRVYQMENGTTAYPLLDETPREFLKRETILDPVAPQESLQAQLPDDLPIKPDLTGALNGKTRRQTESTEAIERVAVMDKTRDGRRQKREAQGLAYDVADRLPTPFGKQAIDDASVPSETASKDAPTMLKSILRRFSDK